MPKAKIGIGDIALYIPRPRIDLSTIIDVRVASDTSLDRKLRRAVDSTGQKAIRFPQFWEDTVSIAAQAARTLLQRRSSQSLAEIRHIAVGTETGVDHSKPVSAYLQGALVNSGIALPHTLSSFQVQHACAGGTLALMSCGSMLAISPRDNESALVVCSDIARYDVPSSAEFTQGAGSAAILMEKDPGLVELDLGSIGLSSHDVDDFFRPLGSTTARVKGQYSMKCYNETAEEALRDHCARTGLSPAETLRSTDYFVFHVPFARMAYTAVRHLLANHLQLNDEEMEAFLSARGFFDALEPTAQVGNIYTGAMYLNLMAVLNQRAKIEGPAIVGKKILFFSYGSGNTMAVMAGTVADRAPEIISSWNLEAVLANSIPANFTDYMNWVQKDWATYNEQIQTITPPAGSYWLKHIREDGYREYAYQT